MLDFTCDACGCQVVEEVKHNVTVSTTIMSVDGDEVSYGESEFIGGNVVRYQCSQCGISVALSLGELRKKYCDPLVQWFEESKISSEALGKLIHDLLSSRASDINNRGLGAQMMVLRKHLGSGRGEVKAFLQDHLM